MLTCVGTILAWHRHEDIVDLDIEFLDSLPASLSTWAHVELPRRMFRNDPLIGSPVFLTVDEESLQVIEMNIPELDTTKH